MSSPTPERAFAARVRGEIKALETGQRVSTDPDVCAVAMGLARLKALAIDSTTGQMPAAARESGNFDALELLDALINGTKHPVWKYVGGARKAGKPPPTFLTSMGRAWAVGAAHAVARARGSTLPTAREAVVSRLKEKRIDVSSGQLAKWEDGFSVSERAEQKDMPKVFALDLEKLAGATVVPAGTEGHFRAVPGTADAEKVLNIAVRRILQCTPRLITPRKT